jgi:hypothetical protein
MHGAIPSFHISTSPPDKFSPAIRVFHEVCQTGDIGPQFFPNWGWGGHKRRSSCGPIFFSYQLNGEVNRKIAHKKKKKQGTKLVFSPKSMVINGISPPVLKLSSMCLHFCSHVLP